MPDKDVCFSEKKKSWYSELWDKIFSWGRIWSPENLGNVNPTCAKHKTITIFLGMNKCEFFASLISMNQGHV